MEQVKYVDLFCGIGGFHYAMQYAATKLGYGAECVFASDIDKAVCEAYAANFGMYPAGDITQFHEHDVPDHDILLGGFPCQAFSIIGCRKGFSDARGTLFFDIARILAEKKPSGFVLENVKQLRRHDDGRTLNVIITSLEELGYAVQYEVLNALDFGLPHQRERIFIVGWKDTLNFDWHFEKKNRIPLSALLEKNVGEYYYVSDVIKERRYNAVKESKIQHKAPTIWHENKSGYINVNEYSCALRANASSNYLLVNGERKLTEREMLRLQGFPESFKILHSYNIMRRFAGNSLPINVAYEVIYKLLQLNK